MDDADSDAISLVRGLAFIAEDGQCACRNLDDKKRNDEGEQNLAKIIGKKNCHSADARPKIGKEMRSLQMQGVRVVCAGHLGICPLCVEDETTSLDWKEGHVDRFHQIVSGRNQEQLSVTESA
jgi:hypothetical protein